MPDERKIPFVAIRGAVHDYDLLPTASVDQWRSIEDHLSAEWNMGNHRRLLAMSGCLEKLSTSLLQVARIRSFHDELLREARKQARNPGTYTAQRGDVPCADFESLVLQGRSALDRLTSFLGREFSNSCSSFRRLRKLLANSGRRDLGAPLLEIIDRVSPWTSGLLAKIGTDESLRDFVAHRGGAMERMTSCFGTVFLQQDRALILDCELGEFPILRTSAEAVQHLSFLVLNSLALCSGKPVQPFEDYQSTWLPQSVVLSDHVIQEPENSPLGPHSLSFVQFMHPSGFNISTKNFRHEIFGHAIEMVERDDPSRSVPVS